MSQLRGIFFFFLGEMQVDNGRQETKVTTIPKRLSLSYLQCHWFEVNWFELFS